MPECFKWRRAEAHRPQSNVRTLTRHDDRFTCEKATVGWLNAAARPAEVSFPAAEQLTVDRDAVQPPPRLLLTSRSWCAAIHSGNEGDCPNVRQPAQEQVHSCLLVEDRSSLALPAHQTVADNFQMTF